MTTGITEDVIQKLIQDALAAQADTHRTELAALAARFQNFSASAAPTTPASPTASSTRSTVPRTRLNMGSPSLVYNGLGGTSLYLSLLLWYIHTTTNNRTVVAAFQVVLLLFV